MDSTLIWKFIGGVLEGDETLAGILEASEGDKRIQRGESSLPQASDKFATYMGIVSTSHDKPVERHVYRFVGWTHPQYELADEICVQIVNRVFDLFYLKSFDTENFTVLRVESVSKDEDAIFDTDKNLWRTNLLMAFLLIRK